MAHLLLAVIYLAFISLGLPDPLLGAAWPTMYPEFAVPVSYAGIISMLISGGTILSSLQSDRVNRRLGTGRVAAFSVLLTAVALFGFSFSRAFWQLCVWAIPYGLGAGSIDAALNNYVALHYESRHVNWLHCMWGVGASAGPVIIGAALTGGGGWVAGYRAIGLIQLCLTAVLFLSLPLWKRQGASPLSAPEPGGRPLTLRQVLAIPGAKPLMLSFFCYCSMEWTVNLWAGSFLVLCRGIPTEKAAGYAGLLCFGIMAGRVVSGFLTYRFSDVQMIRLGQGILVAGIALLALPLGEAGSLAGLLLIGLGCAPIYPCIIHSTPVLFGAQRSQAIIGAQMAFAYTGSCFMPSLFGLLADHIDPGLLPYYLLLFLLLQILTHELLQRRAGRPAG